MKRLNVLQFNFNMMEGTRAMKQSTHTQINWMDRGAIISVLEQYGFACCDSESTELLRETLRDNIMDGTIDETCVDA